MLMRENKGFFSFAFDSTHVKSTAFDLGLSNAEFDAASLPWWVRAGPGCWKSGLRYPPDKTLSAG